MLLCINSKFPNLWFSIITKKYPVKNKNRNTTKIEEKKNPATWQIVFKFELDMGKVRLRKIFHKDRAIKMSKADDYWSTTMPQAMRYVPKNFISKQC